MKIKRPINEFAMIASGYGKYVSVAKNLPTTNARCLIRYEYIWDGELEVDYTIGIFDTTNNKFEFNAQRPKDKVTHWMYLPTLENDVIYPSANENKSMKNKSKRLNENGEAEIDIVALAEKYGFIEETENFYVTKKTYTHEDDDLSFTYKYCINFDENDNGYLDLVLDPNSLNNKVKKSIADMSGITIKEINYFDVYLYGATISLTALQKETDLSKLYQLYFEKFSKEVRRTEFLFGFMMDKPYSGFDDRWSYVKGLIKDGVNESKGISKKQSLNENNSTYDANTQLLLNLRDLAKKECFVDSYIDDFGMEHNAITDIISEYFIDFDNWKDVDDPIPYMINAKNCLILATALFNYDYIVLTKNGAVDVNKSNNVEIAKIAKKLFDKDTIKKAYERVVF